MVELIRDDEIVGHLQLDGGDMFWHFATFSPGPAYEKYVTFFDDYRRLDTEHRALLFAEDRRDPNDASNRRMDALDDELMAALERVNQLELMVKMSLGTYPVRDFKFMYENRVEFKIDFPQEQGWIEWLMSKFRWRK